MIATDSGWHFKGRSVILPRSVRVSVNAADFWDVKQAATRATKLALDDARIEIPFPQIHFHLD